MAAWIALLVLLVSGFALVGRHDAFVIGGMNSADLAMTASGVLLTVWLSAVLLGQMREAHPRLHRFLTRCGSLLATVALLTVLRGPLAAGGQALWSTVGRSLPVPQDWSEAVARAFGQWRASPQSEQATQTGERAVRIRVRADGHFYASAVLNGTPLTLLVDSGAAMIVLKASDARDAGVDMTQLSFSTPIETAGGPAYVARARLRQIRVGVIVQDDVEVLVAAPGRLEKSLLGMSFLSRLRSYEFSGDFLTFRG